MKIVLQLDPSGYLIGPIEADESPLEPGVYLLPRFCIDQPLPLAPARTLPKWLGDTWEFVPDWRGFEYWLPDGSRHQITTLGVMPPSDHLTIEPPPSAAQLAAARLREIQRELLKIDSDGARASREIAIATASGAVPPQQAVTKLMGLETQAQALRAEMAQLTP